MMEIKVQAVYVSPKNPAERVIKNYTLEAGTYVQLMTQVKNLPQKTWMGNMKDFDGVSFYYLAAVYRTNRSFALELE